MKIVDKSRYDGATFYTVELEEDVFVDVRCSNGCYYVMDCEDGCEVFNSDGNTFDYHYDANEVVEFVRATTGAKAESLAEKCMVIVNIEKLEGCKTIVLTGRDKNVRQIAKHLQARLYHTPREYDYFEDYPLVVAELKDSVEGEKGIVVITTQNKEFLDCLLESNIDFVLATVRKNDYEENVYRLRVMDKKDALDCRNAFDMEFRR